MYLQTYSSLIFSDEARLSVLARNLIYGEPVSVMGGNEPRFVEHPLFILLLSLSFLLFGINDLAARIFPILFGSLLVFPTFFLAEKTFNRRIGIISTTLVASHWYLIGNSILVSSRIPFIFFLLTTLYFTIRFIDEKNPRIALLAGFSCGISGLIRGEGFFLIIPLLVYVVIFEGDITILRNRLFWLFIAGFFLCSTPLFIRNILITGNPVGRNPDEINLSLWILKFFSLLIHQITPFSMLPFPLLAIFGLIGFFGSINQWKRCLHLYLTIGFFYFVFSSPMIFGARVIVSYILPVLPIILIFASAGIIFALDFAYCFLKNPTQIRAFYKSISNNASIHRLFKKIHARILRIPITKFFLIAFLLLILIFSTKYIVISSIEIPSTTDPIGYRITGEWIRDNTKPDSRLMTQRSAIGWYANRTSYYFAGSKNYSHTISLCEAWNVSYLIFTKDVGDWYPHLLFLSEENNAPTNLKPVYVYEVGINKIIVYEILYFRGDF